MVELTTPQATMKVTDLETDMTAELNKVKNNDALDIGIVLDVTASMGKWMVRAQRCIKNIIDNVCEACP